LTVEQLAKFGPSKAIKDSVHGYIKLPSIFYDSFIDTPIFQRLRNIEQTGMRILFPSARHDRFIHSIGTCYLGMKAFESLYNNLCIDGTLETMAIEKNFWDRHYLLFSIACLLHDCGHTPFSHSLEYIYNLERDNTDKYLTKLDKDLAESNGSTEFATAVEGTSAKPHEKMSALVVKKYFDNPIKVLLINIFSNGIYQGQDIRLLSDEQKSALKTDVVLNADIDFVMRSILGYKYPENSGNQLNQIKNCFISLLNSSNFDMDSLDYIIRDSQMAGLNNYSIDVDRILNSLTLAKITKFSEVVVSKMKVNNASCNIRVAGNNAELCGNISGCLSASHFHGFISGHVDLRCAGFTMDKMTSFKNGTARFNGGTVNHEIPGCVKAEIDINAFINDECEVECDLFEARKDFNGNIRTVRSDSPITINVRQLCGYISGAISGEILSSNLVYETDSPKGIETYVLSYSKSSLSVLQNIVNARNYEYLWIYGHHKVAYYSNYLLQEILRTASKVAFRSSKSDKDLIEILNYDTVTNFRNKGKWSFGLISDSDLMVFAKQVYYQTKKANPPKSKASKKLLSLSEEFAHRKYRKSVWKSFAEFNSLFSRLSETQKERLIKFIKNDMTGHLSGTGEYGYINDHYEKEMNKFGLTDIVWVAADVSIKNPDPQSIYIKMNGGIERFADLVPTIDNNYNKKISITYLYYKPCENKFNCSELVKYLESKI